MRNAPARAQPASDPPNDAEQPTPATRIRLTPEQQRAVNHGSGNLQLIACAGSGKTEVVAQRVAYLLDPNTAPALKPENIVAFTFTNKAAAELKHRIHATVKHRLGRTPGMAELYVGTIHGFCLNLLHDHKSEYRKYEVLDEVRQRLFVNRFSKQCGLTESTTLGSSTLTVRDLKRYSDTACYIKALTILREDEPDWDSLRNCSVAQQLERYKALLHDRRYFDHSAILTQTVDALQHDQRLRTEIAARIRHVIVDEYQDVNPIQERLICQLHTLGAKLCAVGDDDQTIYQWRGSDVDNIRDFASRYDPVTKIALDENFRSSEGVVSTSRHVIELLGSVRTPELGEEIKPLRLEKQMNFGQDPTFEDGDIVARAFTSVEKEASSIADTCRQLHGISFSYRGSSRGLAWNDMAVLLRSVKWHGDPILTAMKRERIPFVVKGTTGLFLEPEVKASTALFRYLAKDVRPDSPAPTAQELLVLWQSAKINLTSNDLDRALGNLSATRRGLARLETSPSRLQNVFHDFLDELNLNDRTLAAQERDTAVQNLANFSRVIADFESVNHWLCTGDLFNDFARFLYYDAPDGYQTGAGDDPRATPDAVQIMTVHQAKGMEWPVVLIPALKAGVFPASNRGGKTPWALIPKQAIAKSERYQTDDDDERRLFYVAMTRSQKYLHLSYSRDGTPSIFWEDVRKSACVSSAEHNYDDRERAEPQPKAESQHIRISFSDLKLYLSCPYEYKLRVVYGFESPNHIALGYGAGLHNALAEVHNRVRQGERIADLDLEELLDNHMRIPFARGTAYEDLVRAAGRAIDTYLEQRGEQIPSIEFVEKDVEVHIGPDVTVTGRIDFVRRADSDEVTITDLKSTKRSQSEDISELQLNLYALGYEELTGSRPDHIEIFNLDSGDSKSTRVTEQGMERNRAKAEAAAQGILERRFDPDPAPEKCAKCDFKGICAAGQAALTPGTRSPGSASPVFSSTLATATKSITTAAPRRDSRRATPRTRGRGHPADR